MRVSASACLGSGGGGSGSSVDKDDFFEDPKSWPPGFRFHPMDEELILYYLKRKICRRRLKINCIADIDVYKCHPEELPGQSVLKTGDRQWFFFSPRDRKYPNGGRANRGTKYGYWKATGKDRSITWNSRSVGVKKTLVFYTGRAPSGERTDWVMHEYTMEEEELKRCKDVQDYYALYKVFKKSGPGPKNGEQYGAPFKEEDWVDDGELVDSNTPKPANRLLQNGCVDNGELVENNTPNSKNQLLQNGWVDTGELVENNTPRPENQVSQNGYVSFESSAADPSQPPLVDLDEFFRQIDNVPQINQPSNDGFACLLPQFDGVEETRSTIMGPSQGEIACADPVSWYPNQNQFDAHTSFNATQSATSCLPSYPYEAPEVTSSSNVSRQDPFNIDDVGFLEMNDLVGTPPSSSGIINAGENPHIEPMDGSGSRDLFFDANMFPQDMESFDQGIGSDPYFDNSTFVMSNLDPFYPQTQLNQEGHDISQLWMYDQSSDVFHSAVPNQVEIAPASSASVSVMHAASSTNHLYAERQDQNENEDVDSWFSSAISSFLGSVPTRPALAAENPLNRAFVRMSSFSRVTIAARETNVPTRAEPVARRRVGKNRGFLFFSLLGVFCGVLWMMARH